MRTLPLAALAVTAALAGCLGTTSGCEPTTPTFTGNALSVEGAAFAAPGELQITIAATRSVTLHQVAYTVDGTTYRETGIGTPLSPGERTTVAIDTRAAGLSSGDCVAGQVAMVYDVGQQTDLEIESATPLTRQVP